MDNEAREIAQKLIAEIDDAVRSLKGEARLEFVTLIAEHAKERVHQLEDARYDPPTEDAAQTPGPTDPPPTGG